MFPHLPSSLHFDRTTRQQVGAAVATVLAIAGVVAYRLLRKRPSAEEVELERRTFLAGAGRIIDGSIIGIDGSTEDNSAGGALDIAPEHLADPHLILYRYRIAGVTYECAQDVTLLVEHVRHLRVDLPVQVRYDPRNPGNSIVVAENWNGVQLEAAEASVELDSVEDPRIVD